jgi:hypothetical protein
LAVILLTAIPEKEKEPVFVSPPTAILSSPAPRILPAAEPSHMGIVESTRLLACKVLIVIILMFLEH